jgi:hypothetical protein
MSKLGDFQTSRPKIWSEETTPQFSRKVNAAVGSQHSALSS